MKARILEIHPDSSWAVKDKDYHQLIGKVVEVINISYFNNPVFSDFVGLEFKFQFEDQLKPEQLIIAPVRVEIVEDE